ncbi:hypothetical protein E2562_027410 [Oryza meyeriana var. granulata]|uniref:KIB1-4 beta-propeller domain-containing protein n=1 Tax=Oryza meyeriana var. granulata TaxID=110450 RepID=A0A6G1EQC2_9ORYZ|nr:hypothetical protein E2562_027410 [Oryza meyeriana var. granulata]
MAPASFSDLPPEALDDIARRAGPFNNVVRSAVCRPWRRALKTTRLRLLEQPNHPYSARLDKRSNGIELCPLRLTRGRTVCIASDDGAAPLTRIIGSSLGWLVTADEKAGLSLLEATTGRLFPLPPITSSGSRRWPRTLTKWAEGGAGSRPPAGHLRRDANPRRRVPPVIPPARRQIVDGAALPEMDAGQVVKYVDVVFHKGAFYTASREAAVTAWVPDASSSGLHARRVTEPRPECTWAALVESVGGDDLLMVRSSSMEDHAQSYPRRRRRYEVSCYDEREGAWLPVEDLSEAAIMVGIGGRSLCVSTRGARDALRNRLYFAQPYTSGEYYDGHPREYRLPTATAGYGHIYFPYCSSSWFLPSVATELHRS